MKLNAKQKSELFQQLYTMEKSGIPLLKSFGILLPHKNKRLNAALNACLKSLTRGSTLATSGYKSGLFSDIDSLIIETGSFSGKLAESYNTLRSFYDLKTKLSRQMRSQMIFPIVIFSLAVFIAPFPQYFLGEISRFEYLYQTLGFLIKCFCFFYIAFKLPGWLRKGFLKHLGMAKTVDGLLLKIPVLGKYYTKHLITRFIEILGLLLSAGVSAHDALPKTVAAIDNLILQDSFKPCLRKLKSNVSVTEALKANPYLPSDAILFLRTGESSGRLDDTLLHYGNNLRQETTHAFQQIATWIPRIIYGVVCVYMAYSLLSSNPFAPKI